MGGKSEGRHGVGVGATVNVWRSSWGFKRVVIYRGGGRGWGKVLFEGGRWRLGGGGKRWGMPIRVRAGMRLGLGMRVGTRVRGTGGGGMRLGLGLE